MKFGNCSQIVGDPPTLAYLGILNCYFFIGYLGLLDHVMDFEINLFFSFTKVAQHLRTWDWGDHSPTQFGTIPKFHRFFILKASLIIINKFFAIATSEILLYYITVE